MGEHELDLPEGGRPRFSLTERGVVWLGSSGDAALNWQGLTGEPVELTTDPPLFFTADPLIDQRPVPDIVTRDDVNLIGTFQPVLFVDTSSSRAVTTCGRWTSRRGPRGVCRTGSSPPPATRPMSG